MQTVILTLQLYCDIFCVLYCFIFGLLKVLSVIGNLLFSLTQFLMIKTKKGKIQTTRFNTLTNFYLDNTMRIATVAINKLIKQN